MSTTKWVQHVSGQGEKYALFEPTLGGDHDPSEQWLVKHPSKKDLVYYLPRSEYRECAPPERWVDVTERCITNGNIIEDRTLQLYVICNHTERPDGYRVRKVQLWKQYDGRSEYTDRWAFIVEKKEP